MNRRLLAYIPEFLPAPEAGASAAGGGIAAPDDEMELAASLLDAAAIKEMPRFLARLVAAAGPAGRAALRGPSGALLLRALAWAVGRAMPRDGADLKSKAARIFGLELEGLSPEDKEFELARRLLRLLRAVIDGALAPGAADPRARVQAALALAARRHAPGLLKGAAR